MGNQKSGDVNASKLQEQEYNRLRSQLLQKTHEVNKLKLINKQLQNDNKVTKFKQNIKNLTMQNMMQMNEDMFTCSHCQNFYDDKTNIPIMICKKQHSVCEQCVNILKNQKKCAIAGCIQAFKDHGKNRMLLQMIFNKQQLLEWIKEHNKKMKKQMKMNKNAKPLNYHQQKQESVIKWDVHFGNFPNAQQHFEINDNSYLKIGEQPSWHTIKSVQFMGQYEIKMVTFKIIGSAQNSLIFGISNKMDNFYKGAIPSQSISFHINNGHIYDRQKNDMIQPTKGFKWRGGGKPVEKKTCPVIKMIIDTIQKKLTWKIGNQIYAQTIIPEIFGQSAPIYAYMSMYHKGDLVVVNILK